MFIYTGRDIIFYFFECLIKCLRKSTFEIKIFFNFINFFMNAFL